MHLAGVGASAEDVTDTTCCRMMHTQAQQSICCGDGRLGIQDVCCGDVKATPTLSGGHKYFKHDWGQGTRWTTQDGSDEVPWRPYRLHRRVAARTEADGDVRSETVSLDG